MQFLIKMSSRLHKAMIFIAFCTFCVSLIFLFTRENTFSNEKKELVAPYVFSGDAEIIFEDGTKILQKAPLSINTDKSFKVILHLENIGMIDNKTFSFLGKNSTMRCEIDDKIIYRHFNAMDKLKYNQSRNLFLIDLPKTVKNNNITLHYPNSKGYMRNFEINHIKVGKRINIISNYFIGEGFFEYLVLTLLFVLFISIMLTANIFKNKSSTEIYFANISFLSLTIFIYIISNIPLSYFVLSQYEVILGLCGYTSLMFIPAFILNATMQKSPKHTHAFLKLAMLVASVNILVQYILVFANLTTFARLVNYTYSLNILALILSVWALFLAKKDEKEKAYSLLLSFLPLFLGLSHEILLSRANGFISFSDFFKICILFFALFQCYGFFNFYIRSRDEKIKADLYRKLALIDNLTNVGNRLNLFEKQKLYEQENSSFYIILMDINNLKTLNDNYGHKYGDMAIKLLARAIKKEFAKHHPKDIFRIGGDEFVIVYHAPKDTDIQRKLKEFEQKYKTYKIKNLDKLRLGVSYGFAYCDIKAGDDFNTIMHIADQNMYKDKMSKKEQLS